MNAADALPARPGKIERVWGWDLLRGLCALAVALYHLMVWQGLGALHTFGSYGVYLFFVLSGASLGYTYADRVATPRAVLAFLVTRWLRLTPLFALVAVVSVVLFSVRSGTVVDQLPLRFTLNLTYAFGLRDPVVWSLPIGGWSLGIEFVFYLLFPLLMRAARQPFPRWGLLAALAVLQAIWIQKTAGSAAGYEASSVAFHQVPAFGAYFFGGCVIGSLRRASERSQPWPRAVFAWLAMAALLLMLNPDRAGDELLGLRGGVLALACLVIVWISGRAAVPASAQPLARWLGDITYGVYLLHPILFFGFAWFVLPAWTPVAVDALHPAGRWLLVGAVMGLSCAAAMLSERWLESPVRAIGRRKIAAWAARRDVA